MRTCVRCACIQDPAGKFAAVKDYRKHVRDIMKDRDLKETLWNTPVQNTDRPILYLSVDGMDQAKWRIPRSRNLRDTHLVGKFQRPRVLVVGVWVAGVCLVVYLADCTQPHDTNLTLELIARSMERAKLHLQQQGHSLPPEVLIQVRSFLSK